MKSAQLLLIAALPLFSQTTGDPGPQPGDPPARVARLNYLSGDVSFQPAGLDDWTDATLNYPLTTNDHLFVAASSRAELHIGPNAIRIGENSNFGFLTLDDNTVQASLTAGSIEVRVRLLGDDESFEIATPNGAITLLRTGDYRIDTDPGRDATMLTVRSGQAELFSDGKSLLVRARQTAWFQQGRQPDVRAANNTDDFDTFTTARNDAEDVAPHHDYLPEAMVGSEDTYAYGSWQENRDYGWMWTPPVSDDWAPYTNGRWAFVEPWGWTWIDDAPWGFAPFHYGRWALVNFRWVWIPGPREVQVVYAPALVVFVGGGASASVSWFPLGPRDPWLPPWRGAPVDVGLIRYVNRQTPGAIRTMSQVDFIAARRVRPGIVAGPAGQVLGSSPSIVPVRESVLAGFSRTRPPVVARPLVARTPPPPASISFDARQPLLRESQGRPLASRQVDDLRREQPNTVVQAPAVRSTPPLRTQPAPSVPSAAPLERRPPAPQPAPRQAQPQPTQAQPAPAAKPIPPKPPEQPAKAEPKATRPALQDKLNQ